VLDHIDGNDLVRAGDAGALNWGEVDAAGAEDGDDATGRGLPCDAEEPVESSATGK
jgi:hypothetical protein